ncbi:UVI-1 [Hypoxylon argillaceum]|nr:UVI-1 [Hypoxylon argillaceum]KAI1156263.1 UVI-1 [Nemania diffusa]
MLFSKIFTAGAIMATTAMAALTPAQIADSLKTITTQSQNLQGPAQSITIVNAPLIVIGQGPFPPIISGFTQIVTTATAAISQFDGTPKITNQADADLVFGAFRTFVRVHQELLNILIGKAGILTQLPFVGPPVAAVLRSVEGVVDSVAIFLIDTVEARAKDIESDANSLGGTLDLTIEKYQGLSV